MRRLIFLAVGVLFCLGPAVFAQDEGTDDLNRDVFAPFVSRLRVAVRDPQVRITWRDSEDLSDGSYLVYRHTDEINQNTLDAATLSQRLNREWRPTSTPRLKRATTTTR
jgi:hypothetical protein